MQDKGLGWLRDLPDFRDYSLVGSERSLQAKRLLPAIVPAAPATMDLRPWCSPIEDQGALGSCTSNAAAGLYEYFERRTVGRYTNVSRLFIYKIGRTLSGLKGDSGLSIRAAIAALTMFGAPPEKHWPYNVAAFDTEPSAFCYAFAQSFQAIAYARLDHDTLSKTTLVQNMKDMIATGWPVAFGFTVYSSIYNLGAGGTIPYPRSGESVLGGHAVDAVGYDDGKVCPNATPGAFLIRNSWGTGWGAAGYGWLPYKYILTGLASDMWLISKAEWVDVSQWSIPA